MSFNFPLGLKFLIHSYDIVHSFTSVVDVVVVGYDPDGYDPDGYDGNLCDDDASMRHA